MWHPPQVVHHNFSTIICGNCGQRHEIPDNCGNRFCPVCSGPRRRRARAKMDAVIKATPARRGYLWRHIVLTIPSQPDPRKMSGDILASFRRLRQRRWWQTFVDGGFFVLEVTYGGSGWHVHLHILAQSRFIYSATLSSEWAKVSTGYITKIKLAPPGRLSSYLTCYISKTELDADHQLQASWALRSLRLFGAFGKITKGVAYAQRLPFLCANCSTSHWVHERSKVYVEALKLCGQPRAPG